MNLYPVQVQKELSKLTQLVEERLKVNQLQAVSIALKSWKNKEISANKALTEIAEISAAKNLEWIEGADPGMPIARAMADGIISREEISGETWQHIEYLITLVGM